MANITWDKVGERFYETGVSNGALYVYDATNKKYKAPVAWNGLISVSENPTGGEAEAQYADNIKYLNLIDTEDFEATIEAYTYPEEFADCDGSKAFDSGFAIGQQTRSLFGLAYTTEVGNDTVGTELGKKIHLIYGALASPSSKEYSTVNDSPEAIQFSWDITTTPIDVTVDGVKYKPTASLVIDTTKIKAISGTKTVTVAEIIAALENALYDEESGQLLTPDQVNTILTKGSLN